MTFSFIRFYMDRNVFKDTSEEQLRFLIIKQIKHIESVLTREDSLVSIFEDITVCQAGKCFMFIRFPRVQVLSTQLAS